MAEWLYEDGIGESRAALIAAGRIIEARIEREEGGPRPGAVMMARLGAARHDTGRAEVMLATGTPAILRPSPRGLSEGAAIRIKIVRGTIPEAGNPKPPLVRLATAEEVDTPGATLLDHIAASGHPVTHLMPHQPDLLEEAGWSDVLNEAETGIIPFSGGLLRLSPTPAMTLFDVDGSLAGAELALAGAAAAAAAIRRLDIGGSIGIDLPDAGSKAGRLAAAKAVDEILPPPFERTAVNGFGFLQIIRRRERASLPELLRADPPLTIALALLRRAERTPGAGRRILTANARVIARLKARPHLLSRLASRLGAEPVLRETESAAISSYDVQTEYPPPR